MRSDGGQRGAPEWDRRWFEEDLFAVNPTHSGLDPGPSNALGYTDGSRLASARSPNVSFWSRAILRETVRTGAGFVARLVIVSNRVAIPEEGGKAVAAGGLAVAVKEAFTAYEGLWFGWSGNVVENPSSEPTLIDRGHISYAVVDLSPQDHREYYSGFANRAFGRSCTIGSASELSLAPIMPVTSA